MDKNAKIILSLAIALLFPTLIYFATVTFMPYQTPPDVPRDHTPAYPNCDNQYNYSSASVSIKTVQADCEQQRRNYEAELDREQKKRANYDSESYHITQTNQHIGVMRARIALVVGLVGILSILLLTEVVALMVGITLGSTMAIAIATFVIFTHDDSTDLISVLLGLAAFAVMSVLLFFVDKIVPKSTSFDDTAALSSIPQPPSALTHPDTSTPASTDEQR